MKNKEKLLKEDSVLLKIHRIYSKDESLKYMFDRCFKFIAEIKRLRFRVGELESEVAELKHTIKHNPQDSQDNQIIQYKDKIKSLTQELHVLRQKEPVPLEVKIDSRVQELKKECSDKQKKVTDFRNKFLTFSNRFYSLTAKFEKMKQTLEVNIEGADYLLTKKQ